MAKLRKDWPRSAIRVIRVMGGILNRGGMFGRCGGFLLAIRLFSLVATMMVVVGTFDSLVSLRFFLENVSEHGGVILARYFWEVILPDGYKRASFYQRILPR